MVAESRDDNRNEVLFVRKSSALKVYREMFKDDSELRQEFAVVKCEQEDL